MAAFLVWLKRVCDICLKIEDAINLLDVCAGIGEAVKLILIGLFLIVEFVTVGIVYALIFMPSTLFWESKHIVSSLAHRRAN